MFPFWTAAALTRSVQEALCTVVGGHQQTIFVTVNGMGPLGGEGVQLKSVKNVAFVMKIEISPNITSIFKD